MLATVHIGALVLQYLFAKNQQAGFEKKFGADAVRNFVASLPEFARGDVLIPPASSAYTCPLAQALQFGGIGRMTRLRRPYGMPQHAGTPSPGPRRECIVWHLLQPSSSPDNGFAAQPDSSTRAYPVSHGSVEDEEEKSPAVPTDGHRHDDQRGYDRRNRRRREGSRG